MLIVRHKFGKKVINYLMSLNIFNRHFAVLNWGKSYVIRQTKAVGQLLKTEITSDNILTLKFKYHSSASILKEYVAQIDKHHYNEQELLLNIWTSEDKTQFIKKSTLNLTNETNEKIKLLLDKKVFDEKYGQDYNYFISLNINPDINKGDNNNRSFAEITLKYSLKPDNRNSEMRLKSKFNITKNEAKNLCAIISYWKV